MGFTQSIAVIEKSMHDEWMNSKELWDICRSTSDSFQTRLVIWPADFSLKANEKVISLCFPSIILDRQNSPERHQIHPRLLSLTLPCDRLSRSTNQFQSIQIGISASHIPSAPPCQVPHDSHINNVIYTPKSSSSGDRLRRGWTGLCSDQKRYKVSPRPIGIWMV
jgi:hypothetical protein